MKKTSAATNVYQLVTDKIIAQLQQGFIPWRKPWTGDADGAYNRVTGRAYSLINQMILKHNGEYATFNQWKDAGGRIRKGEKSEQIVFWKIYTKETEELNPDGTKKLESIPVLKYFNVFHISQVDGVEPKKREINTTPSPEAEKVVTDYAAREHLAIKEVKRNNRAFYSPSIDYVQVPHRTQFGGQMNEFYSTLFHELTHSTGHPTRLNRIDPHRVALFGSEDYSKEELTAEIGAANLCNICGLETPQTLKNSAAYIQNWLRALQSDNRMIIQAASRAEKATNYILNIKA